MTGTTPQIHVIAGTNGAGKSSVAGTALRLRGGNYYNPDEVARRYLQRNPALSAEAANGLAWAQGRRQLERAIELRQHYMFETTLGGDTITGLLLKAANMGLEALIWYVGLSSPDLHVRRVAERVARGGHAIPEATIRRRYDSSRANLIRLAPHLTELKLWDNSAESGSGNPRDPQLIMHLSRSRLVSHSPIQAVPVWAKPIFHAVTKIARP